MRPGQVLTVRFRPVERLATRPVVVFSQPGRSAVSVAATRLADGSYRASFPVRSGGAGAGSVRIRARDTGGRTNATVLGVTVVP